MFNQKLFELADNDKYIRKSMNGFHDPNLLNFEMLSATPIFKNECKKSIAESEYYGSYLLAAEALSNQIKKNRENMHSAGTVFEIRTMSLNIPTLFLCRQSLELIIKKYIALFNGKFDKIHDLKTLWTNLYTILKQNVLNELDISILEDMTKFIDIIYSLDSSNSTKLRYATDKGNNVNQKNVTFVDMIKIVQTTKMFVNQLELLKNDD